MMQTSFTIIIVTTIIFSYFFPGQGNHRALPDQIGQAWGLGFQP